MQKNRLLAGITMGDPAGIGPEIILKALRDKKIQDLANFLIIGNRFVLENTARLCKIKLKFGPDSTSGTKSSERLKIISIRNVREITQAGKKGLALFDIGQICNLEFGKSISSYGQVALACLRQAVELTRHKAIDILITAPVNKHTITVSGYPFTGHTEYLAQATKTDKFAMMLVGGGLRVALVSRHIALKDVSKFITKEKIYQTISLTASALRKCFGIAHPHIGVCALNPHGGEAGILGREEITIIRPAVRKASTMASLFIEGPLPADSLFYSALRGKFDAVVAMYHDQGLIPLKMLALHQGVNLTLGLPFVRTSCDHGTAYDIAGKNRADPGSMIEAIKLAVKIGSRIKKKIAFS